jgi:hypothetical protein
MRTPRVDEPVTVVAGAAGVHARVLEARGEKLLLEVDTAPGLRGGRGDVILEYVTEDGLCRMLGHAAGDHDAHVLHIAPRARPQLLQRAEVVHATLAIPIVALRCNDRDAVAAPGTTVVLGGGAVAVRGVHGARAGDLYDLRLQLADGEPPAHGQARVHRVLDAGFEGRWTRLDTHDRLRVLRLALEARRTAQRRVA